MGTCKRLYSDADGDLPCKKNCSTICGHGQCDITCQSYSAHGCADGCCHLCEATADIQFCHAGSSGFYCYIFSWNGTCRPDHLLPVCDADAEPSADGSSVVYKMMQTAIPRLA